MVHLVPIIIFRVIMIINQDFYFFRGHIKTEEFINWLEEVEEYFDYRRITESLKVLCVEDCLKNDALIWWEDLQKDRKRSKKIWNG